MHLTLWYIVFVCHQNDVCEDDIDSVYVGGYCSVFSVNCVPSSFLYFVNVRRFCCNL